MVDFCSCYYCNDRESFKYSIHVASEVVKRKGDNILNTSRFNFDVNILSFFRGGEGTALKKCQDCLPRRSLPIYDEYLQMCDLVRIYNKYSCKTYKYMYV